MHEYRDLSGQLRNVQNQAIHADGTLDTSNQKLRGVQTKVEPLSPEDLINSFLKGYLLTVLVLFIIGDLVAAKFIIEYTGSQNMQYVNYLVFASIALIMIPAAMVVHITPVNMRIKLFSWLFLYPVAYIVIVLTLSEIDMGVVTIISKDAADLTLVPIWNFITELYGFFVKVF